MSMLTMDQVKRSLPSTLSSAVTQDLVDRINNSVNDPVMAEHIRDNFLSYTGVMRDGKFKTEDYLNAVMYVSYKLMDMSNKDAYFRTFPNRHASLVAKGASEKDIAAYVSAYNKNKLVNLIYEQTLIPTWVLNQSVYQKAINVQADLMNNASSEMVRMQAANSILTHLAKPKEAAPLINLDLRETSGMQELKATLKNMAEKQREMILSGVATKEIAEATIIDVESTENV